MKLFRNVLMIASLVAICHTISNATIRRVDSNPANGAPYSTIAAAVTASVAGDTIQIAGAAVAYAGANIDKQLVIIGPGFFLGENPDTQFNKSPAKISSALSLIAGSSGTFIMGLTFQTGSYGITLAGGLSNIVIKRNHFSQNVTAIQFNLTNAPVSNIIVQQNYFSYDVWGYSYSPQNNNVYLLNNFIEGTVHGLNDSYLIIKNNIITSTGQTIFTDLPSNSTIQNNILIFNTVDPQPALGVSNQFTNNIVNEAVYGTANGNLADVDMATVFEVSPAVATPPGFTTDSRWALKAGSPAIGAGVSGEDCGIFGGSDPYVLSGIPPIPAIYELTAPTSATQSGGLNITIKAKSRQ